MPDFIIIGAQKAGTSSLYSWLAQHPQLVASKTKEVHFFDGGLDPQVDTFAKGPKWYAKQFSKPRRGQQTFEASPLYLFNPLVAARIREHSPAAKLIALLRNPTQRAVSHYFHEVRNGRESLPILPAMQQEEQRTAAAIGAGNYKHPSFIQATYKARGRYAEQLERYFALFPREQILLLGSEDFFARPVEVMRQVFEFVGVDAGFTVPKLAPQNVGKNRTDVPPDVYEHLDDYFTPHNQALAALLGRDFGW